MHKSATPRVAGCNRMISTYNKPPLPYFALSPTGARLGLTLPEFPIRVTVEKWRVTLASDDFIQTHVRGKESFDEPEKFFVQCAAKLSFELASAGANGTKPRTKSALVSTRSEIHVHSMWRMLQRRPWLRLG